MKTSLQILLIGAVLTCAIADVEGEDVPELINYQGRMVLGTNLANGLITMAFSLYDAPTNGCQLYAETQTVTVVDGLYSVRIGASNNVPGALFNALTNNATWLQLTVGTNALLPRERLVSVPYALTAGRLADDSPSRPAQAGRNWVFVCKLVPQTGLPHIEPLFIANPNHETLVSFGFRGTNHGDRLDRLLMVITPDPPSSFSVRLLDLTHGTTMADTGAVIYPPGGIPRLIEITPIQNVPADQAILCVEVASESAAIWQLIVE